jgi:hypothetical protein
MEFRTKVKIPVSGNKISYQSSIMMIGSCFTDNIGLKLRNFKFNTDQNPFGVLYNPVSIKNGLKILYKKKAFTEKDIRFVNDKWVSFYHHGDFSDMEKEHCLKKINNRIHFSSEFIRKADFLFISLGTSWVYEHKSEGIIVSNCHKIPDKEFYRYKLSLEQTIENLEEIITSLNELNKNLHVIFTISPIRHWKDGFFQNQVSKSTLILAVYELQKSHNKLSYFPSYEIVMDELRDYRFYSDDMTHLSNVAIEYIWEHFYNAWFNKKTLACMNEIIKVKKAVAHRPLNTNSQAFIQFCQTNVEKILQIKNELPGIDWKEELSYFGRYIENPQINKTI